MNVEQKILSNLVKMHFGIDIVVENTYKRMFDFSMFLFESEHREAIFSVDPELDYNDRSRAINDLKRKLKSFHSDFDLVRTKHLKKDMERAFRRLQERYEWFDKVTEGISE